MRNRINRNLFQTGHFVLGMALIVLPVAARADIVADGNAPTNQRPVVLDAGNGVPLVNIQTPSAAGVSRNTYSQFDVNNNGAILNNSRTNAQTQLGGWVQGNPYLATGSARVILNEVNGSNPSQLNGFVEVAGSQAQVVIANPAGISCDGCGFINANRATLSAGAPVLNNGDVAGYRVDGGTVQINGAGLNAGSAGYTDLIGRAVEVNAGVWAQRLNVVAGAGEVNAQANGITAASGSGAAPAVAIDVAIDVSRLGGMYANQIHLIGTSAGVGVRNAGEIGAAAGEVTITADGHLENSGAISAANVNVSAGSVSNSASAIVNGQQLDLHVAGNLDNQGEISGNTSQVQVDGTFNNQGFIDGGVSRVQAETLNNTGSGRIYGDQLALQAQTLNNRGTGAQAPVIAARDRLDLAATAIHNREHALIYSAGDMAIGGALDATSRATGQADTLNNASATVQADGNLDLSVRTVNNSNEHLTTAEVQVSSEHIREYGGEGSPNRYSPDQISFVQRDRARDLRTPDGTYRVWYEYDYLRTVTETQVVQSDPAQIVAGGNLHLNTVAVNNDNSHILAGGDLTGTSNSIDNIQNPATSVTADNGNVTRYRRVEEDDAGGTKSHWEQRSNTGGYQPVSTVTRPEGLGLARSGGGQAVPDNGIALPDNSLYSIHPGAPHGYLVETDPRFANYRNWISSDYMLQQLALDPATTQMRLGDGFYEQQLVREQLAQLTGRRFLEGYSDDEAQYTALLDAGVTFAQAHELRPGVALTAEQVAQLTSDIVWLVEQNVTLADGRTERVLVPQVYVRVRPDGVRGNGALIAADNIQIDMNAGLNNSGTISGRRVTALTAENIDNVRGTLQGQVVQITARNDLNNSGGSIRAQDSLDLVAGRDINVVSTTVTNQNAQGSRTNIDRVAGLYVQSGSLKANAGRDINLSGAAIINDTLTLDANRLGNTELTAGNDFMLNSVQENEQQKIVWDAHNYRHEASTTDIGTQIQTRGDLTLRTGRDLVARAAYASTDQGAIMAVAGGDVRIEAGQQRTQLEEKSRYVSENGLLSRATTQTSNSLDQTTALASTFSGQTTTVVAGQDLSLTGSNVVSSQATTLVADRDIRVQAAIETVQESTTRKTKKSGVSGTGGVGVSIGKLSSKTDQGSTRTFAAASTVGSVEGDVAIVAGHQYNQIGSQVTTPQGDIDIAAETIEVTEARETVEQRIRTQTKQTGLTVSLVNPVVEAAKTADRMYDAAQNTDDKRMQALALVNSGLAANNATANPLDVTVSVSLGSSKSKSESLSSSDRAAGSTLVAGGNVRLAATGAGNESDLVVRGSNFSAGHNVSLKADHEIKLLAAHNYAQHTSSNKSSGGSIGISAGNNGLTADINGHKSHGKANGSDAAWTNSGIQAGNQVQIDSGGNAELKGASVRAHQVTTAIDGDLIIESLQDESYYDSKQKSAGGGFSVGIGASGVSGNLSLGRSNIRSDYVSANEQSGIQAGDGGFQVNVLGRTELIGGAITSTQQAVDSGANQFDSRGGVVLSDLENRARYDARGYAINAGVGTHGQNYNPSTQSGIGLGVDEDSARSTTRAGISGIAGNVSARTGDAETGLKPIFDAERVQNEIDAQIAITQEFGKQAPKAWANYAVQQQREALAHNDFETAQKWGEGGEYRVAGHTLLGGLSGDVAGATGALISASLMPALGAELDKTDLPDPVKQALGLVAAGTLGAIAGSGGAATAVNVEANNRQLHPDEMRKLQEEAARFAEQQNLRKTDGSLDTAAALRQLTQAFLNEADETWHQTYIEQGVEIDAAAAEYIDGLRQDGGFFVVSQDDYYNPLKNSETLKTHERFYRDNAATTEGRRLVDLGDRVVFDADYETGSNRGQHGEFVDINSERGQSQTALLDDPIAAILNLPEAVVTWITTSVDRFNAEETASANKDAMHDLALLQGHAETAGYIQGGEAMRYADKAAGTLGDILLGSGLLNYVDEIDWLGVLQRTPEGEGAKLNAWGADEAEKGTVDIPATSPIAQEGLRNDLLAAQLKDPLVGTVLPGAKAPVTVTAESNIGGRTLVDTNQSARPVAMADPNKPTLVSDLIPPGKPNSTMENAHAEIGLIQQAFDADLTRDQTMTIVVRGEEVCSYCKSILTAAADRSGLNSLRVVDTVRGRVYEWTRESGWKE